MSRNEIAVTLLFAVCGAGLAYFYAGNMAKKQREASQQTRIRQEQASVTLDTIFRSELEKAKKDTGDPCSLPFFELVWPPWGAADGTSRPRLVMLGEEVNYINPNPASFMYWLQPKGDKVELWVKVSGPGVSSKDGAPRRVGEKFSPISSACRGK